MGYRERSSARWFHIANGALETWDGADKKNIRCVAVDGYLESLSERLDKGNEQVRPRLELVIGLVDGEERYAITVAKGTTAYRCIAQAIGEVAVGEKMAIEAWPATQNKKVTVAAVKFQEGETWVAHERSGWGEFADMPDDSDPEGKKACTEGRNALAEKWLRAHPAWRDAKSEAAAAGPEIDPVVISGWSYPMDQWPDAEQFDKPAGAKSRLRDTFERMVDVRVPTGLGDTIIGLILDKARPDAPRGESLSAGEMKIVAVTLVGMDDRSLASLTAAAKAASVKPKEAKKAASPPDPDEYDPFADD